MTCPTCNTELSVVDTVANPVENEIYRLHKCHNCDHSIFTVEYEVIVNQRFEEDWVEYHKNKHI